MPKPVYLITVQEAHKEYNSLMDKIRAKYKQLDSGKFGSPGTPAFDAEACCDIGQIDRFSIIELFPFIVLSSDNTNCKNDIQLFHQLFDELSVYRDYH